MLDHPLEIYCKHRVCPSICIRKLKHPPRTLKSGGEKRKEMERNRTWSLTSTRNRK